MKELKVKGAPYAPDDATIVVERLGMEDGIPLAIENDVEAVEIYQLLYKTLPSTTWDTLVDLFKCYWCGRPR